MTTEDTHPQLFPRVMEVGGELWWVCPVRGPNCFRVRNDFGGGWAADAIDVHVRVSHGQLMEQSLLLRSVFNDSPQRGTDEGRGSAR